MNIKFVRRNVVLIVIFIFATALFITGLYASASTTPVTKSVSIELLSHKNDNNRTAVTGPKRINDSVLKVYVDVNRDGELVDDLEHFIPGSSMTDADDNEIACTSENSEIAFKKNTTMYDLSDIDYQKIDVIIYPVTEDFLNEYDVKVSLAPLNPAPNPFKLFATTKFTTSWRGICGNFPNYEIPDGKKADVSLDQAFDSFSRTYSSIKDSNFDKSKKRITVPLWIKDFAAKTTLTIESVKKDGTSSYISAQKDLPIDNDNNGIADEWERKTCGGCHDSFRVVADADIDSIYHGRRYLEPGTKRRPEGVVVASADLDALLAKGLSINSDDAETGTFKVAALADNADIDENTHDNGEIGDELKNIEEYRGFFVIAKKIEQNGNLVDNINSDGSVSNIKYKHYRTNPNRKDIFVFNKFNTPAERKQFGMGSAKLLDLNSQITGEDILDVHLMVNEQFVKQVLMPPLDLGLSSCAGKDGGFGTQVDEESNLFLVNFNKIPPIVLSEYVPAITIEDKTDALYTESIDLEDNPPFGYNIKFLEYNGSRSYPTYTDALNFSAPGVTITYPAFSPRSTYRIYIYKGDSSNNANFVFFEEWDSMKYMFETTILLDAKEVRNYIGHEIGHAIGMEHFTVNASGEVTYFNLPIGSTEGSIMTAGERDVYSVQYLTCEQNTAICNGYNPDIHDFPQDGYCNNSSACDKITLHNSLLNHLNNRHFEPDNFRQMQIDVLDKYDCFETP